MIKYLVASGCSFTCENLQNHTSDKAHFLTTWVSPLAESLGAEKINMGLGSQGNGLIMKKTMWAVSDLLKHEHVFPEDILAVVMWSGPSRMEWFDEDGEQLSNIDNWIHLRNPETFIPNATGGWVIGNHHWKEQRSKVWYQNFQNPTYDIITTFEHILNLQNFFDVHGIKYVMTTYTGNALNNFGMDKLSNWQAYESASNVSWMNDMIDWSHWPDIVGEADWLRDNYDKYDVFSVGSPPVFRVEEIEQYPNAYWHPTPHGHKLFSDGVLLPFIRNLYDTV